MTGSAPAFILGSASPRRSDLLASVGLSFEVETVDIDEAALVDPAERTPNAVVERIARAKFQAFPNRSELPLLLTADTLVACDEVVLGKPDSRSHLADMLAHMSARRLKIVTAVCVGARGQAPAVQVASTLVQLRELAEREIDRYVATDAGMDKAGGLALQSEAKSFIESVDGCWSNVLGLPLCVASELLGPWLNPASGRAIPVRCTADLCGDHR